MSKEETAVATATPDMCKVVAPATLKEGATFEATVDGKTFTVTVPAGGVKKEDVFEVPYPVNEAAAFVVPSKKFRNGLCDCCSQCCALFMMGWCCYPCLMAQVIERLNFNWTGCPRVNADGSPDTSKRPSICLTYTIITAVMIIIASVLNIIFGNSESLRGLGSLIYYPWAFFIFVVSVCTRMNMRKKFDIDPSCCGDGCCGDCLAVYCCPCCSAIQMASHTHEKENYGYNCGSKTGLPAGAPEIV